MYYCYTINNIFAVLKKFLVILILTSYSIASFGVSLNYFYCCGKLKTVSLIETIKGKDCKGDFKKGCCKNKKVTAKLKTDHKATDNVKADFDAPLSPVIINDNNDFYLQNVVVECLTAQLYKRPPPDSFPKRNILFCIYRI
ncbi:MAG: hypothetical protein ACOVO1_01085 [Chitinophagaceae bacterium]